MRQDVIPCSEPVTLSSTPYILLLSWFSPWNASFVSHNKITDPDIKYWHCIKFCENSSMQCVNQLHSVLTKRVMYLWLDALAAAIPSLIAAVTAVTALCNVCPVPASSSPSQPFNGSWLELMSSNSNPKYAALTFSSPGVTAAQHQHNVMHVTMTWRIRQHWGKLQA